MQGFGRWFGKKAPCPLEDARRRHRRLINAGMAQTQSEDKALVKQLIEHLLTWVWDLPGAWQMFQGTLDLYQSALEHEYKREGRARRLERGDHSVLLMAAAFRCCQTLPQYVVEAEDCKTDAVHVWTHDVQRFFDWLRKWGDEERLPSYKAKAVLRALSPAENVWAATWLFPSRFLYQVSRAPSGRFWAFVLADEPTTPLHRQLGLLPTAVPPRAAVQPYNQTPPSHDARPHDETVLNHEVALNGLVRSFLVTMATALRDGTLRINCWPAQAFADAERIFVVYPQALALCCGHIDRPQVVLDHLVAAGLTRGIERLRVAPEGRARAIVMAGFWLRCADLGHVPDTAFRGAMEVIA